MGTSPAQISQPDKVISRDHWTTAKRVHACQSKPDVQDQCVSCTQPRRFRLHPAVLVDNRKWTRFCKYLMASQGPVYS